MKFFRSVTLTPENCPEDLYAQAVRLRPEAQRGSIFHLEAKPGEEENAKLVDQIVALCKKRGLDNVRGAYSHRVEPIYEPADLEAAPLLWLVAQERMFKGINSNQRDESGRIVLLATEAKVAIKIASIFPEPWIVVSSATRRILENGGLIGMTFEEVAIKGHSMLLAPEPFWELRSTINLPKMRNSVINPREPGWSAYTINDPYVEPHYGQSEIRALGAFDIAHTWERGGRSESPELIISQRLYQYCLKNKIPLEVRPARIDPD
jgi:hypothetical protein